MITSQRAVMKNFVEKFHGKFAYDLCIFDVKLKLY